MRVDDNSTLVFPDFTGNFHFNTLGNLLLNPRAGLLFINFKRGDLLYLTGTAEVIWDSDEIRAFAGAERLLRFYIAYLTSCTYRINSEKANRERKRVTVDEG